MEEKEVTEEEVWSDEIGPVMHVTDPGLLRDIYTPFHCQHRHRRHRLVADRIVD
jgi:hypothetical protein